MEQTGSGVRKMDIKDWTVYYTVNGRMRKYITVKTVEAADAALILCHAQFMAQGESCGIVAGKSVNN
jgi:hypothetical protein